MSSQVDSGQDLTQARLLVRFLDPKTMIPGLPALIAPLSAQVNMVVISGAVPSPSCFASNTPGGQRIQEIWAVLGSHAGAVPGLMCERRQIPEAFVPVCSGTSDIHSGQLVQVEPVLLFPRVPVSRATVAFVS